MGMIHAAPPQVLFIMAAFSRHLQLLAELPAQVEADWGPVALTSPPYSFDLTSYYTADMGIGLVKQFFVLAQLRPADCLPRFKEWSNQLEARIAASGQFAESRPINVDPGYLDRSKVVLASTKGTGYRLYLGQGIHAELTLHYHAGGWQAWPWTYPDFQTAEVRDFLAAARKYFLQLARA